MDVNGFWDLIELSARESTTRAERLRLLEDRLSALPVEEMVDFTCWWIAMADRACSYDMWATCWSTLGRPGTHGFEYAVSWLISLGRDAFETVADDPDAVIDLPQVRHVLELEHVYFYGHRRTSWSRERAFRLVRITKNRSDPWTDDEHPSFELMQYVAYRAYEKVTGRDDLYDRVESRGVHGRFPLLPGIETPYPSIPHGEDWDFEDDAEFARRLPRTVHSRRTRFLSPELNVSFARRRGTAWRWRGCTSPQRSVICRAQDLAWHMASTHA
ncbi:DUF4240 domain-containing protein [Herbidospora yilanensis]|uniref:DUF4240 domain-containing protein n=1 Tax=Herbidospora yilanensis TaxID=354426 RepID=UPI000781B24F|nr:DUF4240 domain-containing protein [Herbidospora yilanensis]